MTIIEILKHDLALHIARRAQLTEGKAGFFIKREGLSVQAVIASYDKIISSIEAEIKEIETKKSSRKKAKAK